MLELAGGWPGTGTQNTVSGTPCPHLPTQPRRYASLGFREGFANPVPGRPPRLSSSRFLIRSLSCLNHSAMLFIPCSRVTSGL